MKKILAFFTSCAMAVSAFAFTAFAEANDITVTFGTASSGDNWSYDGETLTLDGGTYGDITFQFESHSIDPGWTIVLEGDTTARGIYTFYYSTCYATKMKITSDNNYVLETSYLRGSGCDNDIITFDGVTVNTDHLSNGASGAANSNLALTNGAVVNVSTELFFQNISLSGNSTLNANGGLCLVGVHDSHDMTCSFGNIYIEPGSYINCTGEIFAVCSMYYSEYYEGIFDTSVLRVNSPLHWSNYFVPYDSQTYFTVLDENGIPVKSITFSGYSNSKKVTDPDDENQNSANFEMTGSFDPAEDEDIVYSVDVSWGSMEFTYEDEIEGTWNPATHNYDGAEPAGWNCTNGANKVTVTNHSNADVKVSFGYTPNAAYNINGSFDKTGTTTLTRGAANDYDNADSVTASLTLDDSTPLDSSATAESVIGTVIVSLSESQ